MQVLADLLAVCSCNAVLLCPLLPLWLPGSCKSLCPSTALLLQVRPPSSAAFLHRCEIIRPLRR